MTAFQQKSFSVGQRGRDPATCGHGWIVKGRCWYCGGPWAEIAAALLIKLEDDRPATTLASLWGSVPDLLPEGMDSVAYVRSIRNKEGREMTEPALTPDEWTQVTQPGVRKHVLQDAIDAGERGRPFDLTSHAIAAIALHDQPFGFANEDVGALREAAQLAWPKSHARHLALLSVAARIEALLPPETPR